MWFVFAVLSAIFAAITSILAKIGIEGVNSNLATAIRTVVVVLMAWGIVALTNAQSGIAEISKRSWIFLTLSGLATGASWLCYFKALQLGDASKVVSVDKFSIVITLVMAAVFLLCFFLGRNLSVENPGRRQVAVEAGVKFLNDFFSETLGEKGKDYIPYLATVIIYIGIANLIGLLGFKPPTKDMNVTAALAVMSIVLIEVAGIRAKGTKRWLKSFAEPMPVILPINILEIFIKPLSLCMRLFGNVLGSFVIMELLKMVVPAIVPAVFSCYFDIFDGLIQAYVFVFLTGLFIKEATE